MLKIGGKGLYGGARRLLASLADLCYVCAADKAEACEAKWCIEWCGTLVVIKSRALSCGVEERNSGATVGSVGVT